MLAALHIDPLAFLREEDAFTVQALQSVAEGANDFLNKRDAALAKAIASETVKLLSKAFKSKGKK